MPRAATTWVGVNYARGPFSGPGSNAAGPRLAFSLAIDRKQLGSTVCHDSGTCIAATGGLVPPGLRGYAGGGTDPLAAFDPIRARALLKKADPGGTSTRNLVIEIADTPENGTLFQFLQALEEKGRGPIAACHFSDEVGRKI